MLVQAIWGTSNCLQSLNSFERFFLRAIGAAYKPWTICFTISFGSSKLDTEFWLPEHCEDVLFLAYPMSTYSFGDYLSEMILGLDPHLCILTVF